MANVIIIENAELIWRNFRGEGGKWNAEGKRNFNIVIRDEEEAERYRSMGFRIKPKKNEEGEAWTLKVHVNFNPPGNVKPAEIYRVTRPNGRIRKQKLNEDTVDILDYEEAENVDLRIIGSRKKDAMDNFLNAYLEVLYFTPVEDNLFSKYEDSEYPEE